MKRKKKIKAEVRRNSKKMEKNEEERRNAFKYS